MSQSGSLSGGGGGGGGSIDFLTGNVGGPVSEFAGNIFILGSDTLLVTGNPAGHTLTITDSSKETSIVVTFDATPTTLFSFPILANSATTLNATISAVDNAFSQAVAATFVAGARAAGGAPTLIGLPNISISQDFAVPIAINAVISGGNLQIQVVGVSATTIVWRALITQVTS